jgi:hypothetical protein
MNKGNAISSGREVDVRAVSDLAGIFVGLSAGEPKPARSFMNNPG